jgi:SUKH superfamily protein
MSDSANKPALEWEWSASSIDRSVISEVEAQWGIRFPDDYVACAQQHHGGRPSLMCFDLPNRPEAVFNHLLGFVEGADLTIAQVYNSVKDRLPAKVFPFADDPFGNLLCFDYRGSNSLANASPRIVFWDHEVAFRDPDRAIIPVSETFTDLLRKLYIPE